MTEAFGAMDEALRLARIALESNDVPVGAVVLSPDGAIVGRGRNERELTGDPTAHAEVVALRDAAAATGTWNLTDHTLVVTLEPCVMCAGAILNSRISKVVFGAWDDKAGAAGSVTDVLRTRTLPARVNEVVGGVRADECSALLTEFFGRLRD
ncbi:MAG: nucleoside deaminase [Microbacteriaceae bacterium]|nr:nucleoside deaminase [Microbacteriaceae bacterium]